MRNLLFSLLAPPGTPAIIKYQFNGRCYVQWRAFGYEAPGGGNFSKDQIDCD